MNSQENNFENFTKPAQNSVVVVGTSKPLNDPKTGKFLPGHEKVGGVKRGYKGWKPILEDIAAELVEVRGLGKVDSMYAAGKSMFTKAINGDVYAFQVISDRMDGKSAQNAVVKHQGSITYNITKYKKDKPQK